MKMKWSKHGSKVKLHVIGYTYTRNKSNEGGIERDVRNMRKSVAREKFVSRSKEKWGLFKNNILEKCVTSKQHCRNY